MPKPTLPTLSDLRETGNLRDRRVLLRASLNVPLKDGAVASQFRLERALPTITYLREAGARVIIVAHIGRKPEETLAPVATALGEHFPLRFVSASLESAEVREAVATLNAGEVLLLENLRRQPEEKANDETFASALAGLADYYVNDAFAASHRAHASIVGVPQNLPSYFGHTFVAEYEALRQAHEPVSPSLFILGGAKFDTKIPLVEKMLKTYDQVFIAGALANDIYKARGYEVGTSLVSDISLTGHQLLASDKVTVPTDVIVDGLNGQRTCGAGAVTADECILDAGPTTATALGAIIAKAKTIVWNGPLGNYEAGYSQQTEAVARLIAQASGHSLVGGGDTVAAIEALGVRDGIDFVSTGGGAMLTFLEAGTLPAIEAVVTSNA